MNDWEENTKGNWIKKLSREGGIVTVFHQKEGDGYTAWKWVHEGEFSEEFDTAEEAQEDFDELNDT